MAHRTWFLAGPQRGSRPRLHLYCLPHAGGHASVYGLWRKHFPPVIEVRSVLLPGREPGGGEPLYHAAEIVAELYDRIAPLVDAPYALFGHSNGALLAYELVRLLQARGRPLPRHLIVAARAAPHCPRTTRAIHHLPDGEFIAKLKDYGGLSKEVLEDAELMALFLPMLRADFTVAETYEFVGGAPLLCPITAIGGREDTLVSEDQLRAWRALTAARFEAIMLPGGHFFLHETREPIINEIIRTVLPDLGVQPRKAHGHPANRRLAI